MANIYTKKGDSGQTSLFGGKRVSKDSLRVDCYGTVDEANSMLGLAYSKTDSGEIRSYVKHIQKKLFTVAAELASDEAGLSMLHSKVTDSDIKELEKIIDKCYETVGPQTEFVIPGTDEASASLHVARTVIRRAERKIAALAVSENIRPELLKYVNRLSDAIYALARLEETRAEIEETKKKAIEIIRSKLMLKTEAAEKEGGREIEFNLENIKKMAEFAEEKAAEMNVPVVFSAVDEGGNLILLHRMEDSLLGSIDISVNKAFTACALKTPTHELSENSGPGNSLYGIQNTNKGRIVIFGGGFPYVYGGRITGAIGVSGGSVEEDMQIGLYALEKIKEVRA